MSKRTVVILEHNGGRLGNQLWNFANVYAFCLERGYQCKNYCFYEYSRFFDTTCINPLIDTLANFLPGRIKRKIYLYGLEKIKSKKHSFIIDAKAEKNNDPIPFYLPPSHEKPEQKKVLEEVESTVSPSIYFSGWLFRNPVGLLKFHKEITTHIKPKAHIRKKIELLFLGLRNKYKYVIGVHIRKRDYRKYMDGRFFFEEKEVRKILEEYLLQTEKKREDVVFVVSSDESLDKNTFDGINHVILQGNAVEDLFSLSKTNRIIGSDSTFGGFASFYGNIPMTLFSRNVIDWVEEEKETVFNYHFGSYNLQP